MRLMNTSVGSLAVRNMLAVVTRDVKRRAADGEIKTLELVSVRWLQAQEARRQGTAVAATRTHFAAAALAI